MSEKPRIVIPEGIDAPVNDADIMKELNESDVPEVDQHKISVLVDNRFRLTTRGMHWPKRLAKHRFKKHAPDGPVISIGTKLRGKPLTKDQISHTLRHELVHASQELDPTNSKISKGWAIRFGAIAVGTLVGYQQAGIPGAVLGAATGDRAGYTYGPHEIQARKLTKTPKPVPLDNIV